MKPEVKALLGDNFIGNLNLKRQAINFTRANKKSTKIIQGKVSRLPISTSKITMTKQRSWSYFQFHHGRQRSELVLLKELRELMSTQVVMMKTRDMFFMKKIMKNRIYCI